MRVVEEGPITRGCWCVQCGGRASAEKVSVALEPGMSVDGCVEFVSYEALEFVADVDLSRLRADRETRERRGW